MDTKDPDQKSNLAEDLQRELLHFLKTDLELGFTMLEIAKTTSALHRENTLATVGRAVLNLRKYVGEIKDQRAFSEFSKRVDELESAAAQLKQRFTGPPKKG